MDARSEPSGQQLSELVGGISRAIRDQILRAKIAAAASANLWQKLSPWSLFQLGDF